MISIETENTMKKKICSLFLALILILTVLQGSVLSQAYDYGTAEDGVSGNALSLLALNDLANGDFSEGLKYWGSDQKNGVASSRAVLKSDGDNKYININRNTPDNAGKGIISVPVRINGLAVGDEIVMLLDYRVKVYNANLAGAAFYVNLKPLDNKTTEFEKGLTISANTVDVSKWTKATAKATVKSLPESGSGVYYVNIYLQYKAAASVDIDNIVLAIKHNSGSNITPEGYYERLDGELVTDYDLNPNMYGTAEDGISGNALILPALDDIANAGFSDGLKFWGSSREKGLASTEANVQKDGSNSYLEINRETGDSNAAHGVISVPFKINGLSAGDEVFLYFDYKVQMNAANVSEQRPLVASLRSVMKNSTAFASSMEFYSAAKTDVMQWTQASVNAVVSETSDSGNDTFYVSFVVNYNVAAKISIDNVSVVLRRHGAAEETPEGYFERLDGTFVKEKEIASNVYGSAEDGINGSVLSYEPLDDYYNGSFDNGLEFWGKSGGSGYASDNAYIESDGDNKYLVIDRKEVQNSGKGICSLPFKFNSVSPGDVIAITADYKAEPYEGSTALPYFYLKASQTQETKIEFLRMSSNQSLILSSSSSVVSNEYNGTVEGWKNIAWRGIVETAPANGEAVMYIQLYMQFNVACKLYIDNIKILIKHNSNEAFTENGYYETPGGELVSDRIFKGFTVDTASVDESEIASGANDNNYPGLVYSWIGTEEDGIYSAVNELGGGFGVRTNIMNTDFSKGLQYWFDSKSTGYTSKNVKLLTEENGNRYISVRDIEGAVQLNQTKFRLPNAETGDKLYILYKFRHQGIFRIQAYMQNVVSDVQNSTRINDYTSILYEPESDTDWGYGITRSYIAVPDISMLKSGLGDAFSYYMMMQFTEDVEVDNIVFVTLNNKKYYDLCGNEIDIPTNQLKLYTDPADGFDWTAVYGVNGEKSSNFGTGAHNTYSAVCKILSSELNGGINITANLSKSGVLVFDDYNLLNSEISSVSFKASDDLKKYPNVGMLFEYKLSADYSDAFFMVGLSSGIYGNGKTFRGIYSDYKIGSVPLKMFNTNGSSKILFCSSDNAAVNVKNVCIGYEDIGGKSGLFAKLDGTPYGYEIGDTNADHSVDIRDLVCLKKYLAEPDSNKIYFAAANIDNADNSLSATDLTALRKILLLQ